MKASGANVEEKTKEVAKKKETILDMIKKLQPQIELALPKHMTADRLARIAITAVRQSPKLAQCSSLSLLGGIMQSAQLGLEPNTPLGHAYLIPYWNSKMKSYEATFQIGYQGILDLCYRSGIYTVIYAMEVYKNDQFNYRYGIDPQLSHIPAPSPDGEPTHYYAVYQTKDGGKDFRVWSQEKVIQHAEAFSQSYTKEISPWKTNFDEMAKKTVIKNLLKYARKSVELQQAISVDESVNRVNFDSDQIIIESDFTDITPPEETKPEPEKKTPVPDKKEEPPKNTTPKTEPTKEPAKKVAEKQLEIF